MEKLNEELLQYVDFQPGSWWKYDVFRDDTIWLRTDSIYVTKRLLEIVDQGEDRFTHLVENLIIYFDGTCGVFYGYTSFGDYYEDRNNSNPLSRSIIVSVNSSSKYIDSLAISNVLYTNPLFFSFIIINSNIEVTYTYYVSKSIGVIKRTWEFTDSSITEVLIDYHTIQ